MATVRRVDSSIGVDTNSGAVWTAGATGPYATIDAAIVDSAAGDIVLVDDGHSSTEGTIGSDANNTSLQNHIWVVCVDKADDSLSTGATVSASEGVTFGNANNIGVSHVNMKYLCGATSSGDISNGPNSHQTFHHCTLGRAANANSGSELNLHTDDGGASFFFDTTIENHTSSTSTGEIRLPVTAHGMTLTGDTTLTNILDDVVGTFYANLDGFDASLLDGGTVSWKDGARGSEIQNGEFIVMTGMHIPTGTFSFPGFSVTKISDVYTLYNASTGSNLYGLQHATYGGTVTDDIGTKLNADLNGTGFSLNYVGNANTNQCCPVGFELPLCEFWADANATIKINFTGNDVTNGTLNKGDTWIYIGYPDATNASLRKWVSTRDFKGLESSVLGTPGALSTNSASWTSDLSGYPTGYTKYEISQTLTSSAGPVIVYLMCAKASCDIYVDPEPEIS